MPRGVHNGGRRFNAREVSGNENILFIKPDKTQLDWENAEMIMKSIAAQYKQIMIKWGLQVTSFEEGSYNGVWAGINYNAGECICVVLRKPAAHGGGWYPYNLLLCVFAHELAHNHQMNHGPAFQSINGKIRGECMSARRQGYFGDGFWSGGARLDDGSAFLGDAFITDASMPPEICGGAKRRLPPGVGRKRGRRGRTSRGEKMVNGVASLKSGSQTAKKRKSGPNAKAFEHLEASGSGPTRVDGLAAFDKDEVAAAKRLLTRFKKDARDKYGRKGKDGEEWALRKLSEEQRIMVTSSSRGKKARAEVNALERANAFEAMLARKKAPVEIDESEEEDELDSENDKTDDYDDLESEDGAAEDGCGSWPMGNWRKDMEEFAENERLFATGSGSSSSDSGSKAANQPKKSGVPTWAAVSGEDDTEDEDDDDEDDELQSNEEGFFGSSNKGGSSRSRTDGRKRLMSESPLPDWPLSASPPPAGSRDKAAAVKKPAAQFKKAVLESGYIDPLQAFSLASKAKTDASPSKSKAKVKKVPISIGASGAFNARKIIQQETKEGFAKALGLTGPGAANKLGKARPQRSKAVPVGEGLNVTGSGKQRQIASMPKSVPSRSGTQRGEVIEID